MFIKTGDFLFRAISDETLEMVRQWRNAEHVRKNMIFQKIIQKHEHKQWFKQISNTENIYLIAHFRNIPFGVMNYKNIHWDNGEAEAGIFVGNKDFLQTQIPPTAAILLMYFTFTILAFEKIYSVTTKINLPIVQYNQTLGFSLLNENDNIQRWVLHKSAFLQKTPKLLLAVQQVSLFNHFWTIGIDNHNIDLGFSDIFLHRLKSNAIPFKMTKQKDQSVVFQLNTPIPKNE